MVNSPGEAKDGVLRFDFERKLTRLCGRRLALINETRTQYALAAVSEDRRPAVRRDLRAHAQNSLWRHPRSP